MFTLLPFLYQWDKVLQVNFRRDRNNVIEIMLLGDLLVRVWSHSTFIDRRTKSDELKLRWSVWVHYFT